MQDYDVDLLCQLAFQSWLDRGHPMDTLTLDEDRPQSQLDGVTVQARACKKDPAAKRVTASGHIDG